VSLKSDNKNQDLDDEIIFKSFLIAEPDFFGLLEVNLKKQLSMMPEIEKVNLKYDLKDSRDMTEKIKSLGVSLLKRDFVH